MVSLTGGIMGAENLVVTCMEHRQHLVRHRHFIDGKNVVQQANIPVHPAVGRAGAENRSSLFRSLCRVNWKFRALFGESTIV